jgi:hypothetical protein
MHSALSPFWYMPDHCPTFCHLVIITNTITNPLKAWGRFTHIMPFPYGFGFCLSHLIYTLRPCLIQTYHAVPLPCHEYAVLKATSQGNGRVAVGERQDMCKLASVVQRRHVGDMPAFGFIRLPRGVLGSFSEAYQYQTNIASFSCVKILRYTTGRCETKQRLSWARRSLLVWCKNTSACIIYSTKIMITI